MVAELRSLQLTKSFRLVSIYVLIPSGSIRITTFIPLQPRVLSTPLSLAKALSSCEHWLSTIKCTMMTHGARCPYKQMLAHVKSTRFLGHVRMVSFLLLLPIANLNSSNSFNDETNAHSTWTAGWGSSCDQACINSDREAKETQSWRTAGYQPRQSHRTHHPVAERQDQTRVWR